MIDLLFPHLYLMDKEDAPPSGGGDAEDSVRVIERDGKLFLESDNALDDEDTQSEPDSEAETEDESAKSEEQSDEEFSEEFKAKYKGKSNSELLKIIKDQETFIGKQSNEIGKSRGKNKSAGTSPDAIKTVRTELFDKITELTDEIAEIDPVMESDKLEAKKQELKEARNKYMVSENEYLEAVAKEHSANVSNMKHNEEIDMTSRDRYQKDYGMVFAENDWKSIMEDAYSRTPDGKLTQEDIDSAILSAVGSDVYRKALLGSGEMQARMKIRSAQERILPTVGDSKDKTTVKPYSYDLASMSPEQVAKHLEKLPYNEKKKIYAKLPGRR